MRRLQTGKLPHELLKTLLNELKTGEMDPSVVVGPGIGLDSAVIKLAPDDYLVVSSDPITFTAEDIGFYLVTINANDIAVTGARPMYLVVDLLLPEKETDEALVARIFSQIKDAASKLGISVIGGHTEITYGLDRPIAVGTMFGRLRGRAPITAAGMEEGDSIILSSGIAIEGTATIAREKREYIRNLLGERRFERALNFLNDPGISVVDVALSVAGIEGVHAMHDPTEGGIATALHEMASASHKGIIVYEEEIHVFEETRLICEAFNIDPLGLLASGALLISVAPDHAQEVVETISSMGKNANVIGEVKDSAFGIKISRNGRLYDLPIFSQDEITKVI